MVLPRDFFARSARKVAPALLGCVIEHETPDGLVSVQLTEVEAYTGKHDPASHAYRGKTARNAVMFGPPGCAYVYFTYGMHFCVNLVCLPEGTAAAVLLRAGRVVAGEGLAVSRRRNCPAGGRDLARGPARLCQALGVTRALDGADVCDPRSPLRVSPGIPGTAPLAGVAGAGGAAGTWAAAGDGGAAGTRAAAGAGAEVSAGGAAADVARAGISAGPRVGISAAADLPWRFWVTGDPTVSVYRPHVPRKGRKPVAAGERTDGTIPL